MRPATSRLLPLSLCLLATTLAAQPPAFGRRAPRDPGEVRLEHFTFRHVQFQTFSLESLRGELGVYLPEGYDAPANRERRYPWVLWLHGRNGDYRRFHFEGAPVLDALRGEGKIGELVFVAVSAPRQTLYLNGELGGDVEDYVLGDVIDHVEQHFRVVKERAGRAIMGVSLGGTGAMRLALAHPERFAAVAVHSAGLFPADPEKIPERFLRMARFMGRGIGLDRIFGDPIDPKKWRALTPAGLVERLAPKDLAGLRIYLDAGTDDRYGFGPLGVAFHELLEARGIPHEFTLVEGGGHAWGSGATQKRLRHSLPFVWKAIAPRAPVESGKGR